MNNQKGKPIKVYVRIRPLNRHEAHQEEDIAAEIYPGDCERVRVTDFKCGYDTSYRFDRVFDAADSNKTVFHYTTRENLIRLLNGTNCSLIAYGETGSGKTYTLMEDGGITDYTISYLFKLMEADQMHTYKVRCSFVQVYAEKIYDILSNNPKNELHLREHPSKGVYVQGLSEHVISKESHVSELFATGKLELIRARSEMQHLSSRSHSIFQITIQRALIPSKEVSNKRDVSGNVNLFTKVPQGLNVLPKGMVVCGKLDICDLAGSERLGKTLLGSVNQTEAKYINSSLLHLGNVICALAGKKQRHIPFRNSTLTRLLQECLGSECLTAFIICVSPSSREIHETKCSLNFGSRARAITNRFRYLRRTINHELLTKNLATKIRLLEKQLFDRSSHHVPLVCSDSHSQTDREGDLKTRLYVDLVEQTMELTQILSNCLLFNYDGKVSNEGEQTLFSTASSPSYFKSQIKSPCKTKSTMKLSDSHGLVGLLTKRISETIGKLQCHLRTENLIRKKRELEDTEGLEPIEEPCHEKNILEETGWTLSDIGCEIKSIAENIGRNMVGEETLLPAKAHSDNCPSWYRHLVQLLSELKDRDLDSYHNHQFSFHFIYLFQLLQILHLSIEYTMRKKNGGYPLKPIGCSTSVEDGGAMSWSSRATTMDVQCTTTTSLTSTTSHESQKTHRANTGSERKHFRRRRRRKTLTDSNTRQHSSSSPFPFPFAHGSCVEHRLTYPQLRSRNHQNYQRSWSGRAEEGNEDENLKSVYASAVSRYDELRRKYAEAVDENDDLFLKLDRLEEELEREHEDRVQMTSFEDDRDMYYATKDDKIAELEHLQEEYERYRAFVDDSELSAQQLSRKIVEIELQIKAQDGVVSELQSENGELVCLRDENIAKYNGMQTMRRNLKAFHEFFESRISISEELLSLSEIVDKCRINLSKTKFREISEFEQEAFQMVESNVQYEKTLDEVRKKMISYIQLINEMESKLSETAIPLKYEDDESAESLQQDELAQLIPPISPSPCDFKQLEQALSDDLAMQNLLVGEFHKSPEKTGKDFRTSQLIKELLKEKVKLSERIEKIERLIQQLEEKILFNKGRIDVFVKQLGQLDQQLDGVVPITKPTTNKQYKQIDCTESSAFCEGDMELVEVSEMSYDNLSTFMQYFTNVTDTVSDDPEPYSVSAPPAENSLEEEDLEELRSELNYYKRKCSEMRSQSNELSDCLQEDLESTNKSLVCKIDYLKHTNSIIEKEIKRAKKHSIAQKNELKILKDKNTKYSEQVNASMFQSKQMAAKVEITRLQLEKHLSKYKAKKSYLDKCVRDLLETTNRTIGSEEEQENDDEEDKEEEEVEEEDDDYDEDDDEDDNEEEYDDRHEFREESSFNDSGVPPEDLSDN